MQVIFDPPSPRTHTASGERRADSPGVTTDPAIAMRPGDGHTVSLAFAIIAALTTACLLAAVLLLLAPTPANAGQTRLFEGTFCAPTGLGTAPCSPTFSKSYSLSVHHESGDLYVLDASAETIFRFNANGEPEPFSALGTHVIDGKLGPGGKPCAEEPASCDATPENGLRFDASFSQEAQSAVDGSGADTDGNLYVTQNASGLRLVDIFDSTGAYRGQLTGTSEGLFGSQSTPLGVAVGPGGELFVSDWREIEIHRCIPEGEVPVNADCSLFSTAVKGPGRLAAGAGSSEGALFATDRFGPTYKLDEKGAIECELQQTGSLAVAVNPSDGHVLISSQSQGGVGVSAISEYDASECEEGAEPEPITRFGGARSDIAVDPASGRLYATSNSQVDIFSPLVPLPEAFTEAATGIGETIATLNGTMEAFGEEVTECRFEYGPTTAYGSSVPCEESATEIGIGSAQVHADLTGLAGETVYHYRLVVANANGPGDPQGKDRSFQTVSKPQLLGLWAQDVTLTEATLRAQINPQSAATSYRFEWGPAAGPPYEHVTAETSIGSGSTPQTVGLALAGLEPGATYHYRVVATNECRPESEPGISCTSESADLTFTTFRPIPLDGGCANDPRRTEASAFLPDCRAHEMVSPVDKNGGDIIRGSIGPSDPDGFTQATPDGESLTYSSLAGFGELEAGVNVNQYLATRGPEGWANRGIRPPVSGQQVDPNSDAFNGFRQFMAFTPDLCHGWLIDYQTPPMTEEGIDGYPNLYRRDNCGPHEGELEALTDVALPPGTPKDHIDRHESLHGASGDGSHALFVSRAQLTPEAPAGDGYKLYDRFSDALRLVSVLPNGSATSGNLGTSDGWLGNLASAVSEDGSRVYWTNGSQLFIRLNPEQPQSAVAGGKCTQPARACTIAVSTGNGRFWTASADGSRALYTEAGKLYEFDLARHQASPATASRLVAEEAVGVAGAAADLSRVYFVSREALPESGQNSEGAEATEGVPNLYAYEVGDESTAFVATLDKRDVGQKEPDTDAAPSSVVALNPVFRGTRVSPDGGTIAFNSRAPVTGYDNTDTATGRPAVEVFIYNADSDQLHCPSCNPSGGRPQTEELLVPYLFPWDLGGTFFPTDVPAAAWIPTWEQPTYASRPLSDSGGRLFFNSYDALLPRDTNGQMDVYEWEAPGEGSCGEGDPDYFHRNHGCLHLISTGESPYESEFWEASADGEDVFFTTESSLVPPDPGSIDLYDARVGGGFAYPAPRAECEGEACQSPPPVPEAPTPASSSFQGAGNVTQAKPRRRCPKGKRRVTRQGKSRCAARKGRAKRQGKRGAGAKRRAAR
jgi:hypothetical protein